MVPGALYAFLISMLVVIPCPGQQPSGKVNPRLFLSPKAGLVTRATGQVFVIRADGGNREPAVPNLQMLDGDRLYTGAESRTEILIAPGIYLRLDERAEVRALDTALTRPRFELLAGVSIVEDSGENRDLALELASPHGIFAFGGAGLCRIGIEPSFTRIDVVEGEIALSGSAKAHDKSTTRVGKGKRVELRGGAERAPVIARLEQGRFDEFDDWSFQVSWNSFVSRVEGQAQTADPGKTAFMPIPAGSLLEGDRLLRTGAVSFVELRVAQGEYLFLGPQSQLHAVKASGDEVIFELTRGSAIAWTEEWITRYSPMNRTPGPSVKRPTWQMGRVRPFKIVLPQGNVTIEPGCIARFDAAPMETTISVRQGHLRLEAPTGAATQGTVRIGSGKRISLTSSTSLAPKETRFNVNAWDFFERWSLRPPGGAWVGHFEGKVIVMRSVGSYFVVPSPVRLWEGDRLQTARGSRAILRLADGWDMGLNEDSEIEMILANVDRTRIELLRGTAIISKNFNSGRSMFGNFSVEIATPHGRAIVSANGDFRIQIDKTGTTITARSGELQLRSHESSSVKVKALLKAGQVAHFPATSSPTPKISWPAGLPFDEFDAWWKATPRPASAPFRR